jgi:hypothetical protein
MTTPDYAAWDFVDDFLPEHAAYLWLDMEPAADPTKPIPPAVKAIHNLIVKETGITSINASPAKLHATRQELVALAAKLGEKPRFLFREHRQLSDTLSRSDYWQRLQAMAVKAVAEFPDWKRSQRKIQKSGSLQDWLTGNIGANTREAEILKKVLSDFFEELQ